MSNRRFSVEDRHLPLRQNTILEASAGTGKTYSIENIVARLLIDEEPFLLREILLVTFTKAATAELRERVRSHIEKVLALLTEETDSLPDYLQAIVEEGEDRVAVARRRLQQALFAFNDAQIYTIHSFCYRMLREQLFEGNFSLDLKLASESERRVAASRVIKDFFRTGIQKELCSIGQLRRLLRVYKDDSELLAQALLRMILSNSEVVGTADFVTLYQAFAEKFEKLCFTPLAKDFPSVAQNYQKCCDRHGNPKPELMASIELIDSLIAKDHVSMEDFDRVVGDGLIALQALDRSLLKKKSASYKVPEHFRSIQDALLPVVSLASDPEHILVCLAARCQRLLREQQERDEVIGPDDLLAMMQRSLDRPEFLEHIQKQFSAVIIDEFQDTDPTQWEIFKKLFMEEGSETLVYLVGDPKQSIYRFRNADIYTYFEAVKTLGRGSVATLNTNYRSHPDLVAALNQVFSSSALSRFIDLPKEEGTMEYSAVEAGSSKEGIAFSDHLGRLHFFIASGKKGRSKSWPTEGIEKSQLFPFIAKEIMRIHDTDKAQYSQMAVLVRDRYQAERLSCFFKECGIPFAIRRSRSLVTSPMLRALRDVMEAALNPRRMEAVKRAYGGKIIGATQAELLELRDPMRQEKVLAEVIHLGELFTKKGFASFYEELLRSQWKNDGLSVAEEILSRHGAAELFQGLQQLAELVMDEQARSRCAAEGLIDYIDSIARAEEDDERYQLSSDSSADAVQVLTLHVSKGLEFDVVFALGLAKRSPQSHRRITEFREGQSYQLLVDKDSQSYRDFCAELDAEKMRQLYVGMTRAKDRLYVPIAIEEAQATVSEGEAAPMELLLARTGKGSDSWVEDYDRIGGIDQSAVMQALKQWQSPALSYSLLEEDVVKVDGKVMETTVVIHPPIPVPVQEMPCKIHSFTSLEAYVPKVKLSREIVAEAALPAGPEVGTLLHEILAELPLKESSLQQVPTFLRGTLLEDKEEEVQQLLAAVLNTALAADGSLPRLNELDDTRVFKEMEFLYPWDGQVPADFEISTMPGFLRGFIDLIFEHDNKIYVVDYKSNLLPSYEQVDLELAMQEHHYHLQAAIYGEAVKRYMQSFSGYEYGGCIYAFLRGMDGTAGAGIYHVKEDALCQV